MTHPMNDLAGELNHRARLAVDAGADYLTNIEAARAELNKALSSINAGKLAIAQDCAGRAQQHISSACQRAAVTEGFGPFVAQDAGSPYADGATACRTGKPKSANPFDPKTEPRSYNQWIAGWEYYHELYPNKSAGDKDFKKFTKFEKT